MLHSLKQTRINSIGTKRKSILKKQGTRKRKRKIKKRVTFKISKNKTITYDLSLDEKKWKQS